MKSGVPISKSGLPICPSNCTENGFFPVWGNGLSRAKRLSVWTPKTEAFGEVSQSGRLNWDQELSERAIIADNSFFFGDFGAIQGKVGFGGRLQGGEDASFAPFSAQRRGKSGVWICLSLRARGDGSSRRDRYSPCLARFERRDNLESLEFLDILAHLYSLIPTFYSLTPHLSRACARTRAFLIERG